jgi:DNA-binding SARP family transcriptional activator
MRITVLGRLSVTDAVGASMPAEQLPRRARQLLGVLAARHDRIQTKDALADALWGEDLPSNHAATLEHYVSVVRRRLQPGGGTGGSFIVTRSGGYFLDTSRAELDLAELRRRVQQLDAHPLGGPERLRLHQEILDLATALPFEEDAHAEWTRTARDDVREATLTALLQLSEATLGDDPARSLRLAQQAVGLDPYLEQSYRAAMSAVHALGRPDEALRWYERCRQILDDELGVAPAAETLALRQSVLDSRRPTDEPPAAPRPVTPQPATPQPATPQPATPQPAILSRPAPAPSAPAHRPAAEPPVGGRRGGAAVFVGRHTELALLLDEPPAPLVHLVGPPGAGKSAILAELRGRAPGRVGVGHGPAAGSAPTLRLTWLRTALTGLDAGTGAAAAIDAATAQQRPLSLDELEVLAIALSRPEPVLLAVDDAAELDETSVSELAWLGQRVPLLSIVLTYRYPSACTGRPIAELGTPIVLRLAPLRDDEVAELGDPGLTELTGGIPALVGAAHRAPEVAAAVAMQIARSRTRWMPDAGWEVLRLSAALGALRVGDLAALTDRPVSHVLDCVDQLIHAHLLVEEPGGHVRHRSALIQAAVAEQVSNASGVHLRERLAAVTP